MSTRLMDLLGQRVPVWCKVLRAEFGIRSAAFAVVLLFSSFCALLLTAVVLPRHSGWPVTIGLLGVELTIFWQVRSLDFVGKLLCAYGVIRENLSQDEQAAKHFWAASIFLGNRYKAYAGLFRVAEGKKDFRELANRIADAGSSLRAETALLLGRCLRAADDPKAALPRLELADKLAPSDAVKLELAEAYLETGAADRCVAWIERMTSADVTGHSFFLRATALRTLGKTEEALLWGKRATQARPCDPDYQIEHGRILELLGLHRAARRRYDKAIRVHSRNPEAHFRRALLALQARQTGVASKDFERCYYYDNTRTDAYLICQDLKEGYARQVPPSPRRHTPAWIHADQVDFDVAKGDRISVGVLVCADSTAEDCRVAALEPFGAGLEVEPSEVVLGRIERGRKQEVRFCVKAKRSDAVNLNQPWVLNFVISTGTTWASQLVRFHVCDSAPGRVLLVVTNDHEPRLDKRSMRRPGRYPVKVEAVEADLATKADLAQVLAEKYCVKWTHMLDAGAAVSLPRWAGGHSKRWKQASDNIERCYRTGRKLGHDYQVHLHLSSMPQSYFFCYDFNPETDVVSFDLDKKNAHFPGWQINSWANVVQRYGRASDSNSRLGSLTKAVEAVRSVLVGDLGLYTPILFRAGQWDSGKNTAEREKSILALRESGFLADSSVTEGYSFYRRPFSFGTSACRAAYFTLRNNPEQRARRLIDAGMLEVVPVVLPQGGHPVTPRDDPRAVVAAYHCFLANGQVKPGRHIIMEIEHLATVAESQNGKVVGKLSTNRDWSAMEHHFAKVDRECPALEGVGASEAICSWLDYYSPELVVRLAAPSYSADSNSGAQRSFRFSICFLGEGILCEQERLYHLAVPMPRLNARGFSTVRILQQNAVVFESPYLPQQALSIQLALSHRNLNHFILELEMEPGSRSDAPCSSADNDGGAGQTEAADFTALPQQAWR